MGGDGNFGGGDGAVRGAERPIRPGGDPDLRKFKVDCQISITKVYNLHGRLRHLIVINLLINHLGRPRIDWNSDVEPRPKPPNRSWAPAIENQGNKYVMDGSCEAAPL